MPKALSLTGITGARVGSNQLFSGRTHIVGSAPTCDFVLHDYTVFPRHAEIRQALDRWFVKPLTPGAAVYINDKAITEQGRIREGDIITLGSMTFRASLCEVVEQKVGDVSPSSDGSIPQIGEYLIRRGVLDQFQLSEAVQRQEILRRQGRKINLGDLLHEMGYVTSKQIEQALQDQRSDFFGRFRD